MDGMILSDTSSKVKSGAERIKSALAFNGIPFDLTILFRNVEEIL